MTLDQGLGPNVCRKLSVTVLQMRSLIAGAKAVKLMRQGIQGYLPGSVRGKHRHFHSLTERFLIEDDNHPAVKQNNVKLKKLKVRVNGEMGLRAKQVG